MAKLNWEIYRSDYGYQFNIVANTRSEAISKANAHWLSIMDWEIDLIGQIDEEGNVYQRSEVPAFTAKKVSTFTRGDT